MVSAILLYLMTHRPCFRRKWRRLPKCFRGEQCLNHDIKRV